MDQTRRSHFPMLVAMLKLSGCQTKLLSAQIAGYLTESHWAGTQNSN
jgi:hypothetical protein